MDPCRLAVAVVLLSGCAGAEPGRPADARPAAAPTQPAPGEGGAAATSPTAMPSGGSKSKAPAAPPTSPSGSTADPGCSSVEACETVLASATDRDVLEAAGVWLATARKPAAVKALTRHVGEAEFLARLDRVDTPGEKTRHLSRVFAALASAPIPAVATACRALSRDPEFIADADRITYLLQAAAAVRPMNDETVAFFVETNAQGYAPANAITLGNNASPKALALFEKMLRDTSFDVADRVEFVHRGLLPVRTEASVLRLGERMLASKLPGELEVAVVETLFDYKPAQWFGKVGSPPAPPPWTDASAEALRLASGLARRMKGRKSLPAPLRARLAEANKEIQAALSPK